MFLEDHITQLAVCRRFDFWRREGYVIVWTVGFWVSYHSDPLERFFVLLLLLLHIIVSTLSYFYFYLYFTFPALHLVSSSSLSKKANDQIPTLKDLERKGYLGTTPKGPRSNSLPKREPDKQIHHGIHHHHHPQQRRPQIPLSRRPQDLRPAQPHLRPTHASSQLPKGNLRTNGVES